MRVLIVSHSGKTSGGAERSLMALVRCVARERADVRLTMLFPGDGQSALRAFAERLGVETLRPIIASALPRQTQNRCAMENLRCCI